jgi:hypothetical protein
MRTTSTKIILIAALVFCTATTHAKEYIGFNLCGKATTEQIAEIARAKGGEAKIAEKDEASPGAEQVNISNYPIGEKTYKVMVTTFKGVIDEIAIDSPGNDLDKALDGKYGAPKGPAKVKESAGMVERTLFLYNTTKFDTTMVLTREFTEPIGLALRMEIPGFYGDQVKYRCKALLGVARVAREKYETEKAKKGLKGNNL